MLHVPFVHHKWIQGQLKCPPQTNEMAWFKGNGPIQWNNKGLIEPINATLRWPYDLASLGFRKVPFDMGIIRSVLEFDSPSEPEYKCI